MPAYVAYFDGAITFNTGGDMGMGCYVVDGEGEVIYEHSSAVRKGFNNSCNVAEYLAFEVLLDWVRDNCKPKDEVTIYGDSQLVCLQMQSQWKIKDGMYVKHAHRCKKLLLTLKNTIWIKIEWIPRKENDYCDRLSKRALGDLFV